MPPLTHFAGVFLTLSVLSSLATGLVGLPAAVPGALQLIAGALLWNRVPYGVRRVSLILLIAGAGALAVASHPESLFTAISKNQQMIAMLTAIGLLRYSPLPRLAKNNPRGPLALWQTLFGLHWLAAVINISALAIFSERLADADHRLGGFQGLMLTRGFSLAALWSPFFVAMGVALTYAPGAHYQVLLLWGLPFSQMLLVGMIWRTIRTRPAEVTEFQGYCFHPSTMIAPGGIAVGVILFHQLFPRLSIVTLITLFAPCYPLLASRVKPRAALIKHFVLEDMPRMGPEVVLFVSAGVLGSGLSSIAAGRVFNLAGEFSPLLLICAGLALILAAACVGIHPVVGVTLVSGLVSNSHLPPNLLALSFLCGWGLGVLINPISGVHLLLTGRYHYPNQRVWRWNLPFVCTAYLASCGWFWLYTLVMDFGAG